MLNYSTGSGDVDTSKVVKADADGMIDGASGEPRPTPLFGKMHVWRPQRIEWRPHTHVHTAFLLSVPV